jgi:hypothetical protein
LSRRSTPIDVYNVFPRTGGIYAATGRHGGSVGRTPISAVAERGVPLEEKLRVAATPGVHGRPDRELIVALTSFGQRLS